MNRLRDGSLLIVDSASVHIRKLRPAGIVSSITK